MSGRAARLRDVLRWEGPGGLLRRALARAVRPLLRVERVIFFEQDVTASLPPSPPVPGVDLRPASPEDVRRWAVELARAGTEAPEVARRLAQGEVLLVAAAGARLAGVAWVTRASPWVDEIGRRLVLDPGDFCLYGAVTFPEWRGRGIAGALWVFADAHARARGCTHRVAWVSAGNVQSLRTTAKLGYRRTRTVTALWLRGRREPLVRGASGAGRPAFALTPRPDTADPSAALPGPPAAGR